MLALLYNQHMDCWALACLAQMGLWVVAVFALDGAGWVFVGGGGAGPGLITHEAVGLDGVPCTLYVGTLGSGAALGGTSGGIAGVTTAGAASGVMAALAFILAFAFGLKLVCLEAAPCGLAC